MIYMYEVTKYISIINVNIYTSIKSINSNLQPNALVLALRGLLVGRNGMLWY